MTDETNAVPEEQETPAPGTLAPVDGDPTQEPTQLPANIKKRLKSLVKEFAKRDSHARRYEVREARRGRFFYRGQQHLCFDSDNNTWRPFMTGTGTAEEDKAYAYTINIYQSSGRQMTAVLSQSTPGVRFEPQDPGNPVDIAAAAAAEKLRKIIERDNDMPTVLADWTRNMWTDGRTHLHIRNCTDGARYGYDVDEEGNKTPRTRERIDVYGVLEVKVPINMRDQKDFPFLALSYEIDKTTAASLYPDLAQKLSTGSSDSEEEYERNARIATMQGSDLLTSSGDSMEHLVTYTRTWLRPSAFSCVEDDLDKQELMKMFPDGVMVATVGESFAEAVPEALDDHWVTCHGLPGDGQNTPALGGSSIDLQTMLNETVNMRMDAMAYGIPTTFVDPEVVSSDAINDQESRPGGHYPAKPKDGMPLAAGFFVEPPVTLSPDLGIFANEIQGPILQAVTGLQPAVFGGGDPHNQTASGVAQAREMAMGQIGLIYRAVQRGYAEVIRLAVMAARNRKNDIKTMMPGKRRKPEVVEIQIQDLTGDFHCFPNQDEAYPETYSAKRGVVMQLVGMGDNPAIGALLQDPDNLALIKDAIGIEDLRIPGADSRDKQLTEISELVESEPVPNVQVAAVWMQAVQQAQAAGQQPPPQPPETVLFSSTVPIDQDFDDHATEFTTCKDWLNSAEGQKAKESDPAGFRNVRLHALQHKAAMEAAQAKAQQAAAPPPPAPKQPSESVNFKDLPPYAQAQMLQQLGFSAPPPPQALPPQQINPPLQQ